jgi:hypothetical protein
MEGLLCIPIRCETPSVMVFVEQSEIIGLAWGTTSCA